LSTYVRCPLHIQMGVGKTLQAIALLAALHNEAHCPRPHLLVVPLSTLQNWEREVAVWAPSLNLVALTGTSEARKVGGRLHAVYRTLVGEGGRLHDVYRIL